MALNVITNQTASIAHRNLVQSDMEMTKSLSKLSSGQRVVSAKDDAASMAIGSRIKADVASLRQIQVNSTQAISLLQVAEGAQARVYDMLVRLKSLASQAGSSQLSNTERNMLDTEYQQLLDEIDRVAAGTTFNGSSLVNANMSYSITDGAGASSGFFGGSNSSNWLDMGYGGITYANTANSGTVEFSITGTTNVQVNIFATAGGKSFSAVVPSNLIDSTGALVSGTAVRLTSYSGTAAVAGDNSYITLGLAQGADLVRAAASDARGSISIGQPSYSTFNFKVGIASNPADNEISLNLRGINTRALGLNLSTISTQARADAAYAATGIAIDLLLTFRAEVGAGQSRMESTAANVSIVIENMEAARSAYLDLDVAQEMSTFTNKQILQQAGIAMIAQANQLPQNLLRLFQQ